MGHRRNNATIARMATVYGVPFDCRYLADEGIDRRDDQLQAEESVPHRRGLIATAPGF